MHHQHYTTTFVVDKTPDQAFNAVNNVRGWWSGEIGGVTNKAGEEFTYTVPDVHYCKMNIAALTPGRKIIWDVVESDISYLRDNTEWAGTRIIFDITPANGKTEVHFTHHGLVPEIECYNECSNAWGLLVNGNLRQLILTGKDQPNLFAKQPAR